VILQVTSDEAAPAAEDIMAAAHKAARLPVPLVY
jgi:hypothetical protein